MTAAKNALVARNREALKVSHEDEDGVIVVDGRVSRELFAAIARGVVQSGVAFLQGKLTASQPLQPSPAPAPLALPPPDEPNRDVMTADEVAAFLGVDRNTVYDYAGRGVIPHQRLGKRMLFRRGALVAWLDNSCKATLARRGS